jgi:hypothetical protein
LALWPSAASAANPNLINFQGKVVNGSGSGSAGTNVSDGSYSFRFCLYSTATPATPCTGAANNDAVWRETKSLTVTSGVFQTELGDVTTLPDFSANSNLYLGVTFNNDAAGEMTPRIHLDSVPYAKYSDNSGQLGGLAAGNFVQLAQGVQNDTNTTNPSIFINKNNASGIPNILQLQKSSANVLVIDNGGLVTVQPAASLTGGQTAVTQTLTNGDSTGGTVIGYNQTISVSNTTSGGVTQGIKITLTDNTALVNTNTGINITVNGSNTSQSATGVSATSVGEGLRGRSGGGGFSSCGSTTYPNGIGTCGESLATGNSGASTGVGVLGSSKSGDQVSFNNIIAGGTGTVGLNEATGTASSFYIGVKGLSTQTAAAAYTSTGVFGKGNGGAGATIYGGYFTLGTGGATAGAALYATNSTVATNILDLQDGNAGSGGTNISVLTVGNGGVITANSNSASGLVVNNSSSSKAVITIDTSGNQVILGTSGASGVDGQLTFKNATGSGTAAIVLTGNPSTNYTYQLPTGTVSSNQCLQSGTVSSGNVPLTFGSCGTGGGTLASTYNSAATTGNTIQLANAGGGIILQDASSSTITDFFTVQSNSGSSFKYLSLTMASSVPHLRVYKTSDNTKYADIYWDTTNNVAVFGSSTGTTQIGTSSGPISLLPGTGNGVTITADAASTYTTTTGSLTLTGAAASTWSTTAGLLTIQGAGGLTLNSSTTATITVDSGTTGAVVIGATNTTNAKAVSLGNANSGSTLVLESGTAAGSLAIGNGATAHDIDIGTSATAANTIAIGGTNASSTLTLEAGTAAGAILIGNGATAHGIQIGTGAAVQTVKIGSTNGASVTTIQGGSGNIILNTSTGNTVQIGSATTDTNSTILVLDSYNNSGAAGDPAGTNGGMYYNTFTNTFRCYENSVWHDCLSHHVIELGADVADSSGACTFTAATGLSFAVKSATNYRFHANIIYTSAATTTGLGLAISGPATPTLVSYESVLPIATATPPASTNAAVGTATAYDGGGCSASTPSTASTGWAATLDGLVRPSANGTVQLDFASEINGSAITIKAGSTLEWW